MQKKGFSAIHFSLLGKAFALLAFAIPFSGCTNKEIRDPVQAPLATDAGLFGIYYNHTDANVTLYETKALTRQDENIDFSFGNGNAAPGVTTDRFAIQWIGYLVPNQTDDYYFCTCANDGMSVAIDGNTILRKRNANVFYSTQAPLHLEKGKKYRFKAELQEVNGESFAQLFWSTETKNYCKLYDPAGNGVACKYGLPQSDPDGTNENMVVGGDLPAIIPPDVFRSGEAEYTQELSSCDPPSTKFLPLGEIPDPNDANTQRALKLFSRLGGASVPVFDPRIKAVKEILDNGQTKAAARYVTENSSFLDVTVRTMASKMSTRDQRPDEVLNDFIATFVGVTRDRVDARKLLSGDFLYRATGALSWYDSASFSREQLLDSNLHYSQLDAMNLPLKCSLAKLNPTNTTALPLGFQQMAARPQAGVMDPHPDPAGVLTSRSFSQAHVIAGTNRRMIEKSIEHFLCTPKEAWRDAQEPDNWIGRDVARFRPADADPLDQYNKDCKTCHTHLDALRGAFAFFTFDNGIQKYSPWFPNTNNMNTAANNVRKNAAHINEKYFFNVNYTGGYTTMDDSWVNVATERSNGARFGWGGITSGNGVREYGRMLAGSRAFPECMAKQVYTTVCGVDPTPEVTTWLSEAGLEFAKNGYDLRDLFESVGLSCME